MLIISIVPKDVHGGCTMLVHNFVNYQSIYSIVSMFVDDAWHKHLLRLQTNNVPVDFPLASSLKIWLICAVCHWIAKLLQQTTIYNASAEPHLWTAIFQCCAKFSLWLLQNYTSYSPGSNKFKKLSTFWSVGPYQFDLLIHEYGDSIFSKNDLWT